MFETIEDKRIKLLKSHANYSKYFGLFDKHITRYENNGENKKILLIGICNESVILEICNLNKNAHYYIIDSNILQETLPIVNDEHNFKFIFIQGNSMYNILKTSNMKFDCIIMNPPYDKNLHLKILAEAIKHLNDEKSICVNLSPIRWLQDPFAKYKKISTYKKFENSVCKYIDNIEIFDTVDINEIFKINIFSSLGIYKLKNHFTNFNSADFWKKNLHKNAVSIIEKTCLNLSDNLAKHIKDDNLNGYCVPICIIAGGRGNLPIYKNYKLITDYKINDVFWADVWNSDPKHQAFKTDVKRIIYHIKLDNEISATNFYDSYNTTFLKYICEKTVQQQNIQAGFLPYMQDYSKPWTNERFCKHFNITGFISDTNAESGSEWETILKEMEII